MKENENSRSARIRSPGASMLSPPLALDRLSSPKTMHHPSSTLATKEPSLATSTATSAPSLTGLPPRALSLVTEILPPGGVKHPGGVPPSSAKDTSIDDDGPSSMPPRRSRQGTVVLTGINFPHRHSTSSSHAGDSRSSPSESHHHHPLQSESSITQIPLPTRRGTVAPVPSTSTADDSPPAQQQQQFGSMEEMSGSPLTTDGSSSGGFSGGFGSRRNTKDQSSSSSAFAAAASSPLVPLMPDSVVVEVTAVSKRR